jgi:hypothetical protein
LPISDRYLYPAYVALVLLGATTVPALTQTSAMRRGVAVAIAAFVALSVVRAAKVADDGYEHGWGYAAEAWRSSPAVAYVNALPRSAVVYSDDPYALLYLTAHDVHNVPNVIVRRLGTENPDYAREISEMQRRLRATDGVVVIFDRDRGAFVMPVLPHLLESLPLEEKARLDDAIGYVVAGTTSTSREILPTCKPTNAEERAELTILMPRLDEAEIATASTRSRLPRSSGVRGEVPCRQRQHGRLARDRCETARASRVAERGYGAALKAGIRAANGRFVIMGDADDSYDFSDLDPFVMKLRDGAELVMGNRFKGGIAPGAMPGLHKYLGNPVLSGIGRLFFKAPVGDFHCGLRGFDRKAISGLGLESGAWSSRARWS